MPVSKERYAYSRAKGRDSELRFVSTAKAMGFEVEKSSSDVDIFFHIDYFLTYDGQGPWGVDVKRESTSDEIWCEFKNVKGEDGWMYGKANIIAFDMPEMAGFVVVDRIDLVMWCEQHVPLEYTSLKKDAYRKRYTRSGRNDEITKINLVDISSLESYRTWDYSPDCILYL